MSLLFCPEGEQLRQAPFRRAYRAKVFPVERPVRLEYVAGHMKTVNGRARRGPGRRP